MLEEKNIVFVSCGLSHVMCLNQDGKIFGWGDGSAGCLGLGDGKKRLTPCPISFFENKRCIDVTAGDRFTVVIAEVFPETEKEQAFQFGLIKKKHTRTASIVQSNRKPICGGDVVTQNLRHKVMEIVRRNKLRQYNSESRNIQGGALNEA